MFIQVWCEYDFNGKFGGNNNEDVFIVTDGTSDEEVEAMVLSKLSSFTGVEEDELEGLFSWKSIVIKDL